MLDVLIIGAGPVGLTAALALSSLGKNVRIIDKNIDNTNQIRAIGINPRSLTLLEPFGFSNALIANGIKVTKLNLLHNTDILIELNFNHINCPYNFMLSLTQHNIEKLFNDELIKRSIIVERNTELISYKQYCDKVQATILHQGKKEEVTCQYLFGADGAHSLVRKQSGIPFTGYHKIEKWSIFDVTMDWSFSHSNIFMFNHGFLIALPITDNRYSLVSNNEQTISFLLNKSKVNNINYHSQFNVSSRLANNYQSERIFLGGDAAHIFPPIGGRGMNLGIEDAVIFSQLLVNNRLKDYEQLQRAKAKQISHDSEVLIKVATLANPVAKFARNQILIPILLNSFVQKRFCGRMTGLENSLTAEVLTKMTKWCLAR